MGQNVNTKLIFPNDGKEIQVVLKDLLIFDWFSIIVDIRMAELKDNLELLQRMVVYEEEGIYPDFLNLNYWLTSFLDLDLCRQFLADSSNQTLRRKLYEHVLIIISAAGLQDGEEMMTEKLIEDAFGSLLLGEELNFLGKCELAHSLGQLALVNKNFAYRNPFVLFFNLQSKNSLDKLQTWEEWFFLALGLRVLWSWFYHLPDEDKTWLCQKYTYSAIALGLPIKKIFTEYLYTSIDAVNYILRDKLLFEALSKSEEIKKINGGVEDIFPFKGALKELLDLYQKLENASLLENIFADEKNDTYLFQRDSLALLVEYFWGPVDIGWGTIALYYKDKNPRVSLTAFIDVLKNNEKIEDEDVRNRVLSFNDFLHKENILPVGKDLVYFDESDNQFHWNEDF